MRLSWVDPCGVYKHLSTSSAHASCQYNLEQLKVKAKMSKNKLAEGRGTKGAMVFITQNSLVFT